ncbi:MAG: TonB-dependent receptor [Bacteroidales bacterium]|nr:TonB-dependent receptor [Bacteroidales bacterium]
MTARAFAAMLAASLTLYASALDFHVKDATVRESVMRLQRQSGMPVTVNADNADLDRRISLDMTSADPIDILKEIFKGQQVACTSNDGALVVRRAPENENSVKAPLPKISGTVVAESDGEPLIGATVLNKAEHQAVVTDIDGHFTIAAKPGQELTVTYIGFREQHIKVGASTTLDIRMAENSEALTEVVVVGFGSQKKVNITGAVSVLDNGEINGRPVSSTAHALQGLDPAMNIGINTGRASSGYSIDIRGTASLNGGEPLILVDGIEMPLNRVNPNDIETVSILKDASASAVYGAKASAGVVLVTTKSGANQRISVSYNGRYGWAKNTTSTDYITSGYDWGKAVDKFNYIYTNQKYLKYDEDDWAELEARRYDKTEHPDRPWVVVGEDGNYKYYGNFDWYGYLFRRTRPQQEHNVSIRGGNDKVNYFVSGRYYSADGLMNIINDPFNSYNFRTRLKINLAKWARFDTNVNYFYGKTTWVGFTNIEKAFTNSSYAGSPLFVPRNPDGSIVHRTDVVNQSASVCADYNLMINTGNNRNSEENNDIAIKNNLELDLAPGLTAHLSYAYRTHAYFETHRRANAEYSNGPDKFTTVNTGYFINRLAETDTRSYRNTFEGYLDYSHRFGADHNFKVMAGVQYDHYNKRSKSISREGLVSDELDDFDLATGETYTLTGGKTAYKTLGIFGRANYDYAGRYLLEVSARADGSSRFRRGHRWGLFPSGSAGWRMSEEKFWRPLSTWWNNAKLRVSVGSLGNQQVADFLFYDKITTGNFASGFTFNGMDPMQYSAESNPVASDLTWEKVTTYDVGLDLAFLNNRLTASADYYVRNTTDMMMPGATLPGVYGVSAPKQNSGDMRTNGWELVLRWHDHFRLGAHTLNYGLNASIGDYKSVVTRINNETRIIGSHYKGEQVGEIWGYTVDGLFASDEEAAAYQEMVDVSYFLSRIMSKGAPEYKKLVGGDPRYIDTNGDGVVNRGKNTVDDPGDRKVIGNTLPRYSYTFGGEASWLGIDFSILFQGVGKRDWYPGGGYSNLFWGPYCRPHSTFISQQLLDQVWSPENPDAYFPFPRGSEAFSSNSNSTYDNSNSHYTLTSPNTRYLQSVAYLRLKNVSIGYTLPCLKKYVQQIRVYVTGENLAYWSPLKKHCKYIDPEGAISGSAQYSNSGEVYNFSKTYSIGVDITF